MANEMTISCSPFSYQQKFANFMNLKKNLMNFSFVIFSQHRTQCHTMIIVAEFQFVNQSIIHHRT